MKAFIVLALAALAAAESDSQWGYSGLAAGNPWGMSHYGARVINPWTAATGYSNWAAAAASPLSAAYSAYGTTQYPYHHHAASAAGMRLLGKREADSDSQFFYSPYAGHHHGMYNMAPYHHYNPYAAAAYAAPHQYQYNMRPAVAYNKPAVVEYKTVELKQQKTPAATTHMYHNFGFPMMHNNAYSMVMPSAVAAVAKAAETKKVQKRESESQFVSPYAAGMYNTNVYGSSLYNAGYNMYNPYTAVARSPFYGNQMYNAYNTGYNTYGYNALLG